MADRIKTMKQATALAAGGLKAVAGLHFIAGLTASQRAASIRALGMIGGLAALKALGTYRDSSPRVVKELLRASRGYSPEAFGLAVFAGGPLSELTLSPVDAHNLALVPHMTNLRKLTLEGAGVHLPDLSVLGTLSELESLKIGGISA